MDSAAFPRLWFDRALYPALALAVVFFHLLPLSTLPAQWAGPDLIVALTLALALRRPECVPVVSVAAVGLLSDLLLQRPPGLMALLLVLGAERLKTRARTRAETGFAAEWAAAALVIVAMQLIARIVLGILLADQAPLRLSMMQMSLTVASYPLVVLVGALVFGLRRRRSGADEATRARS